MAEITWKNVNAPDLTSGVNIQNKGSQLLGQALNQFKGVADDAATLATENTGIRTKNNTTNLSEAFSKASTPQEVNDLLAGAASPDGIRAKYGREADVEAVQAAGRAKLVDLEQKGGKTLYNEGIKAIGDTDQSLQEILAGVTKKAVQNGWSPETESKAKARLTEAFNTVLTPDFKQQRQLDQTTATGAAEIATIERAQEEKDRLFAQNVDTFRDLRTPGDSGSAIAVKDAGEEDFFNLSTQAGSGGDDLLKLLNTYKKENPNVPYWKIKAAIKENPVTDTNGFFGGGFSMKGMKEAIADISLRDDSYQEAFTRHMQERNKNQEAIMDKRVKLQNELNGQMDAIRKMGRKFLKPQK